MIYRWKCNFSAATGQTESVEKEGFSRHLLVWPQVEDNKQLSYNNRNKHGTHSPSKS